MGLIKNQLVNHNSNHWLVDLGFKYGTHSGAQGQCGYTKTFMHKDDTECLWITVNLEDHIAYLYNEWDCGGLLWENELVIPDKALNDTDSFITWLDDTIDLER